MKLALDQVFHVAIAMVLVFLCTAGILGCVLAGLLAGLVSEAKEAGGARITLPELHKHFGKGIDPWADLAFWAAGGLIAGIILYG